MATESLNMDYSKYDFKDSTEMYVHLSKKGLSRDTVIEISKLKDEPQWMLDFRLRSYEIFMKKPMPTWGGDLSAIDFQNIYYYMRATEKVEKNWDDVPEKVKNTFEKLGIPEAEKKFLAGVGAQYESEVVYHSLREDLAKQGVLFLDTDAALKEHPELFKKYFGKIIPPEDNKFAALNSAVWSGGSFIYIPPGVKVDMPLQAYFRINAENIGQFERTLIIVDEGAEVHYIEGCTAPVYSSESLHVAVVELVAHKDAKLRYTTIQNWSSDVYNLVTKRAYAYEGATVEWIDGNIGSKLTMKYPGIYLLGERAYGETLSIAFAGKGQHQDTGAKMIHLAPNTTSKVTSKSVSRLDGRSTYRGLLSVAKGATNVKATVRCDALLLDDTSSTETYPYMEINQEDATITHEATVGKIGDEQIFYLMSRGFNEEEALTLIVNGFMEPFTKELPMEYAVELNRLIKLEMDDSVG
ncbi:Fe-S cluster assembly protein SufB [Marine Group I thaumarchaeote]|uniref:Fe-S cluster assembly protein SufB n=1 Tax=Marine Group I thaumarchaeote TaxID=2511932 RepID=A0A7K4NGR3_9ARCH|nr:MAG: Fe-S cluster assembly protein SufB [Nitrosopumilus sp. YT1]NMI81681.1 Fe-S cluster assembly protein SufB [Candidatus Nitrosopumilus sp. MTA1]NWJ19617.1 Fe-S cluster assembly protein SufB [Marine Group I thaumarchaeote]NWJ28012.1 Fe-S cluster assembly protein SufB [Marine Group I thaumarchaeote]NWJ56814.1 Fe-S cluster assembly protein SufB [Marine Group I thaumarchaeote]